MKLQHLRKSRQLSQEQLAEISGLNVRTIQRIEKGATPNMRTLKCLASALNIEVSEIAPEQQNTNQSNSLSNPNKALIFLAIAAILILFGAKSENTNQVVGAFFYICAAICFIVTAVEMHKGRLGGFYS